MSPSHADLAHADGFWRQFPITVHFQEPCEIVGQLSSLDEVKSQEEYLPKLRLQQKDGTILIIIVGQTRLLAELARLKPAVGDYLKITYHGEAKRAAPGMNPTKEFTVEVKRAGQQKSQPQAGPGSAGGSAAPENAPGVGKTTP